MLRRQDVTIQLARLGFTQQLAPDHHKRIEYRNPDVGISVSAWLAGRNWRFTFSRRDSQQTYTLNRKQFFELDFADLGKMVFELYTPLQLPFVA